jgi:hypothetical protein
MLIVPTTIAWKNAARPTIRPTPAPTAAASVATLGSGPPLIATQPHATTRPTNCVQNVHCTVPMRREFVPPRKSLAPPVSDDPSASSGPNTRYTQSWLVTKPAAGYCSSPKRRHIHAEIAGRFPGLGASVAVTPPPSGPSNARPVGPALIPGAASPCVAASKRDPSGRLDVLVNDAEING